MRFRAWKIMRRLKKQAAAKQAAAAQQAAAQQTGAAAQPNGNQTQNTAAPATNNTDGNNALTKIQTTNTPVEEKDGLEFYINSMRNRRKKGAPLVGISALLGSNESLGV